MAPNRRATSHDACVSKMYVTLVFQPGAYVTASAKTVLIYTEAAS